MASGAPTQVIVSRQVTEPAPQLTGRLPLNCFTHTPGPPSAPRSFWKSHVPPSLWLHRHLWSRPLSSLQFWLLQRKKSSKKGQKPSVMVHAYSLSAGGGGTKAGRSQVQVHSETLSLKTKQQHKEKEKRSEEILLIPLCCWALPSLPLLFRAPGIPNGNNTSELEECSGTTVRAQVEPVPCHHPQPPEEFPRSFRDLNSGKIKSLASTQKGISGLDSTKHFKIASSMRVSRKGDGQKENRTHPRACTRATQSQVQDLDRG